MKKHYNKRKKVVIDALDGKIINDTTALKLSNVEAYVEKNGMKIVKLLTIFLAMTIFINSVYAFDPSYMTKLDLSVNTNVYMLLGIFAFSVFLIFLGFRWMSWYFLLLGCIILLFLGIILLTNGFNVVLSILICFIALILIWIGGE